MIILIFQDWFSQIENEFKNNKNKVYVHREVLVKSLEKRNMDMITVSSTKYIT